MQKDIKEELTESSQNIYFFANGFYFAKSSNICTRIVLV